VNVDGIVVTRWRRMASSRERRGGDNVEAGQPGWKGLRETQHILVLCLYGCLAVALGSGLEEGLPFREQSTRDRPNADALLNLRATLTCHIWMKGAAEMGWSATAQRKTHLSSISRPRGTSGLTYECARCGVIAARALQWKSRHQAASRRERLQS